MNLSSIIRSYIDLTKPTIMLLVIFTGSAAMVVEGSLLHEPLRFILVLVGLYLTGGCANALNQIFERDIDAQMARTKKRRPLPSGKIGTLHATIFAVSIGLIGTAIFAVYFNLLTAGLAMATILFYSLYYTLWLKPNTAQNIVIGGIAGAMAPVGAWAAATGQMAVTPWIMFLIIFFWTPPHFWALALYCKDDYRTVDLPMMPVVKGERSTLNQMLVYTVVLFAVSLSLLAFEPGWFYLVVSVFLGSLFVKKAIDARREKSIASWRSMFRYSLVYLFALFLAIMVDGVV